jgi:hypothetical protein
MFRTKAVNPNEVAKNIQSLTFVELSSLTFIPKNEVTNERGIRTKANCVSPKPSELKLAVRIVALLFTFYTNSLFDRLL